MAAWAGVTAPRNMKAVLKRWVLDEWGLLRSYWATLGVVAGLTCDLSPEAMIFMLTHGGV